MGAGGLPERLSGLPGVVACTVTADAVTVAAAPGTDLRLLGARAQVVCAHAGDGRRVVVVAAPAAPGGRTAHRRAAVLRRADRPAVVVATSALALALITLLPGEAPSGPRRHTAARAAFGTVAPDPQGEAATSAAGGAGARGRRTAVAPGAVAATSFVGPGALDPGPPAVPPRASPTADTGARPATLRAATTTVPVPVAATPPAGAPPAGEPAAAPPAPAPPAPAPPPATSPGATGRSPAPAAEAAVDDRRPPATEGARCEPRTGTAGEHASEVGREASEARPPPGAGHGPPARSPACGQEPGAGGSRPAPRGAGRKDG